MADQTLDLPGEIWKACPNLKNHEVSSLGRVRSAPRSYPCLTRFGIAQIPLPCRVKRPRLSSTGYFAFSVKEGPEKKTYKVHRLICLAFHGPPPEGRPCVLHNNGNPEDNRPENLRWGSKKENTADAIRHGTFARGERQGHAVLTDEKVLLARSMLRDGARITAIADLMGVSRAAIYMIRRGESWRHVQLA